MKMRERLEKVLKRSWVTNRKSYTCQHVLNAGMYIALSIILFIVILYPLMYLLDKAFNIKAFLYILGDIGVYKSLWHTLIIGTGVTFFSILFGGVLAWLVVRTDYPFKKAIKVLTLVGFAIPSYILSISWIEIFSRNGYVSRFFKWFDYDYQGFPYSMFSVIMVLSIHLYPMAFMAISNGLKAYSSNYERAASLCGGSKKKVFTTITLPMLLPSFLSIGLLIFSRSMANFGVPASLMLPIGEEVVSTKIYSYLSHLEIDHATVLAMLLVMVSAIIYFIHMRLVRNNRFSSATNHSYHKMHPIKLGKSKWVVTVFVMVFQGCVTGIPLVSIIMTSFLKRWGLALTLENLTWNNYIKLLTNPYTNKSFVNSIVYGVIAATIAIALAALILYLNHMKKGAVHKLLMVIATWPMAFPNIVLAVAATLAFLHEPLKLYGTMWIIIITYVALFLPIAVKHMSGIMTNIHGHLLQASKVAGATMKDTILKIVMPLIAPGMTSAWIFCFLIALREIPISLLLYSSGTETIGVMLFTLQSNSYGLEMTSTLAVVVIGMSLMGQWLTRWVRRRWI